MKQRHSLACCAKTGVGLVEGKLQASQRLVPREIPCDLKRAQSLVCFQEHFGDAIEYVNRAQLFQPKPLESD